MARPLFSVFLLGKKNGKKRSGYARLVDTNFYRLLAGEIRSGGPTPRILLDVIRNLLDSWLDSEIIDLILEISAYQTKKAHIT